MPVGPSMPKAAGSPAPLGRRLGIRAWGQCMLKTLPMKWGGSTLAINGFIYVKKWVEPLNFIEIQFSHDFIVVELDIQ